MKMQAMSLSMSSSGIVKNELTICCWKVNFINCFANSANVFGLVLPLSRIWVGNFAWLRTPFSWESSVKDLTTYQHWAGLKQVAGRTRAIKDGRAHFFLFLKSFLTAYFPLSQYIRLCRPHRSFQRLELIFLLM